MTFFPETTPSDFSVIFSCASQQKQHRLRQMTEAYPLVLTRQHKGLVDKESFDPHKLMVTDTACLTQQFALGVQQHLWTHRATNVAMNTRITESMCKLNPEETPPTVSVYWRAQHARFSSSE